MHRCSDEYYNELTRLCRDGEMNRRQIRRQIASLFYCIQEYIDKLDLLVFHWPIVVNLLLCFPTFGCPQNSIIGKNQQFNLLGSVIWKQIMIRSYSLTTSSNSFLL